MSEIRLGDDIDDFCVKCKRVTNHAVVSVVDSAAAKVRCLRELARIELRSAKSLARLHELALFLCAVPDSVGVRAASRALLARFAQRVHVDGARDGI